MNALRRSIQPLRAASLTRPLFGLQSPAAATTTTHRINDNNDNALTTLQLHNTPIRRWRHKPTMYERKSRMQSKDATKDDKPTLSIAKSMPMSMQEMDNATLVTLGAMDNHGAHKEMLKRHIMTVDNVSYEGACKIYVTIENANRKSMYLLALPYQIGVTMGITAAFASFPLVFHHGTAAWFNELFVTTDVPEPKDLETMFEVGAWTWNWMEPPLGQISFFLLCLQYCRSQLANMGIKPYTRKIKQMRGVRLAESFPQYDSRLLIKYSESASIYKKYFS